MLFLIGLGGQSWLSSTVSVDTISIFFALFLCACAPRRLNHLCSQSSSNTDSNTFRRKQHSLASYGALYYPSSSHG